MGSAGRASRNPRRIVLESPCGLWMVHSAIAGKTAHGSALEQVRGSLDIHCSARLVFSGDDKVGGNRRRVSRLLMDDRKHA